MRSQEISINVNSTYLGQMHLEFPDEVVFVFNPLYIDIQMDKLFFNGVDQYMVKRLTLSVSTSSTYVGKTESIEARLYNGKARIYISRLLELFFTDVRFERSKQLFIGVIVNGKTVWSQWFMCLWGNLAVGDRLAHYGAFKYDKSKPYFERKRIWFRNFPFTVSMFAHSGISSHKDRDVAARYDGLGYDERINTYYPPIWGEINSIEDEWVQGLDEETVYSGEWLEGGVFDKQEQCFYGSTDDYCLYSHWTGGYYVPGEEMYNVNGKARTDMIWAMPDGKLVRYDYNLKKLVSVPYGRSGVTGIYEINPSFAFPEAKRYVTLKQKGEEVEIRTSVFDKTFDHTFWMSGEMATYTELIIDNSTAGHYLRWIDRLGMFQYYLFTKGKETLKNKLSSDKVLEDYAVSGMYFANHQRVTHVDGETTVKCCAVHLPQEIYDYVSSVITSPVIDLYMGKTRFGDEMWVPVNIVASSHNYDPTQVLHDLEISFTLPPTNAQTL